MALDKSQQITELIKNSKLILITCKQDWTGDDIASALALGTILKKMDKAADIVCPNFKSTSNLSFLPTGNILPELKNLQKFIVSINTAKTKVGEFYYDNAKDKLNIYLTPENGKFQAEDVTTAIADYKYDLIITVNTPDLESLGKIYEHDADFFLHTPKINIDHSPLNEVYGNINIINIAAAATAEVIYDLAKSLNENLIDESVATYLLSGIVISTKNFKTKNITPHTLAAASALVASGAKRELIIQQLYQNRFVSTLKLWGRVLSRLNNDLDDKIVWSTISHQDFLETATTADELADVIDELIVSMPKTELIILLYENKNNTQTDIHGIIYSTKTHHAQMLSKKFDSTGNQEIARFKLENSNLATAEREVLTEVKSKI